VDNAERQGLRPGSQKSLSGPISTPRCSEEQGGGSVLFGPHWLVHLPQWELGRPQQGHPHFAAPPSLDPARGQRKHHPRNGRKRSLRATWVGGMQVRVPSPSCVPSMEAGRLHGTNGFRHIKVGTQGTQVRSQQSISQGKDAPTVQGQGQAAPPHRCPWGPRSPTSGSLSQCNGHPMPKGTTPRLQRGSDACAAKPCQWKYGASPRSSNAAWQHQNTDKTIVPQCFPGAQVAQSATV
jgi:hypothetical protein